MPYLTLRAVCFVCWGVYSFNWNRRSHNWPDCLHTEPDRSALYDATLHSVTHAGAVPSNHCWCCCCRKTNTKNCLCTSVWAAVLLLSGMGMAHFWQWPRGYVALLGLFGPRHFMEAADIMRGPYSRGAQVEELLSGQKKL